MYINIITVEDYTVNSYVNIKCVTNWSRRNQISKSTDSDRHTFLLQNTEQPNFDVQVLLQGG